MGCRAFDLENLALIYSIYVVFISNVEASIQNQLKKILLKLMKIRNLEDELNNQTTISLFSYLPEYMHKYIHQSMYLSSMTNESMIDSLTNLQFMLKLNKNVLYIIDNNQQAETFLTNKRHKTHTYRINNYKCSFIFIN